ncbi:MAG: type II toxin-antitoxin system RelE/ParE family toxin [Rhizobiaceae bacterium]|nr:type II toxin-antitoxin system RelE/ParE family toxin [Rhizobiaceae bacterium]
MKVVFTEGARQDLLAIGDYIARDNPLRALSFTDELEDRCMSLERFPNAYPILARRLQSNIRRMVHGNYSIFYSVLSDTVSIIHVLNGAMDYEKILFPEES